MPFVIEKISDGLTHGFDTIIDVRSPSEYEEDHVPGAVSLPVLSDEERARVGTIYVRQDPFLARKVGAALVAKNAARHLETALVDKPGGWRPLVYCWRGGQRSASFASILKQIGWRVEVIEGGYKSWRRAVARVLYDQTLPVRFIALDGYTGTAKTELLNLVSQRGVATLDLEALAAHRGSILGDLAQHQPSQKAFESALAATLGSFSAGQIVVVEAESSRIGQLNLPPAITRSLRVAPRIEIQAPLSARAEYLARQYADQASSAEWLNERLRKFKRFIGSGAVEELLELARAGNTAAVALKLIECHYDSAYRKSRVQAPAQVIQAPSLEASALEDIADRIAGSALLNAK